MSILYKTTRFADTFSGDKETNVRVQLLSWDTLDTKAFVEYLADKHNISKGDVYKNLNGSFCEDKEPGKNHRAESIEVKNIVFKAEKRLKRRITAAGFEKYNPERHNKRKY